MKKLAVAWMVLAGCAGRDPDSLPDAARYRPAAPPAPQESRSPAKVRGLTLEQALSLAVSLHPDLVEAQARVEAAEGRALQAGLMPNPTLLGRMESAPFEGGTTGEAEFLAGVSLRLPVGGRLGAAREAERLERGRLQRQLEVRRIEIRAQVHGAFASALYASEVARLQTEALDLARRAVAVARVRREAGDATADEVARVEMEEVRARLEEDRGSGLRDLAFVSLASSLGDAALRVESVEGKLEAALELPALESILAEIQAGPYEALAQAEAAAARGRLELARVERIPDVTLELFYRRLEHSEKDAFDVGIGIPLPLFDRNQGRVGEAEAEVRAARARGRATRSEAVRRARAAHVELTAAVSRARLLREELSPRSETVLKTAEVRYAGGDMSLAEILPLRRERTSVQLAYLDALREVMAAWADLRPFVR